MTAIMIAQLIGGILLGIALVYGVLLALLGRLKAKRMHEARLMLKGQEILYTVPAANCLGFESLGMGQVRGSGVLTFTKDQIHFLMWLPKREFKISMASITGITTPKSHLGKTKLKTLLKVSFKNELGQEDSAAWMVRNLDEVKAALEKIRNS